MLIDLMNDIKYKLPHFLVRGLQFSWQNGEELANWTGTFNFTDDGAMKSGSDTGTRYQHPREWLKGPLSVCIKHNVSAGCMKNAICNFLWLLGSTPRGTEDARDTHALCCLTPSRLWGHFVICHIHLCSTQDGDFLSWSFLFLFSHQCYVSMWQWQFGRVGLRWKMSEHDSIDAHRAHCPEASFVREYVF